VAEEVGPELKPQYHKKKKKKRKERRNEEQGLAMHPVGAATSPHCTFERLKEKDLLRRPIEKCMSGKMTF
jgi:hypothetical protein